jgi:hypothetical protein
MAQVKFIKHEKEKIPFRISYLSLKQWQGETGKTLADLDQIDTDLALLEPLFFHAVTVGYNVAGQKNPFTREELTMILDDCWLEFRSGVGSFFQNGVAQVPNKKGK